MRRHLFASLGLALALTLAVAACGSDAGPSPAADTPPPTGGNAVTIASFAFGPASLTVKVGATVSWTNTDSAAHTVAWQDGSPGSGTLESGGASYTRTFNAPGTFAYICGLHPSMAGTIIVEP